MIKQLNNHFHISAHSKISEKAILLRLATTITVIVFCLIAMGTTAFAYFSHDITSSKNTIKSANFEANVSVQITNDNGEHITVNTDNRSAPYAVIDANTTYFVTLKHSERSTAKTGFIIITADRCESRYHTQQLGRDGNGNTETLTFTITSDNDTRITFLSHWGTSSYYGYKNNNNPLYITKDNNDITLSVTPPLMLSKPPQTLPSTTEKTSSENEPQNNIPSTSPKEETKKPAEITVPESTKIPDSTTEPITSETTSTETSIKTPETTVQITTVPETTALLTTAPETALSESPAEIQEETTLPDSPETSGSPINEANE